MKGTTLRSGQHAPHSLARQAEASAADLTDDELIAALPGATLSTAEGLCSVPVRRSVSIAGWICLHQIWYIRAMATPDKVLVARFYRLASGREPAREWLLELSAEDRKSIGRDLMKIEFGWPCGPPLCRPLTGYAGLYEVRSRLTDGRNARVFFSVSDGIMVLLHGFIKKSRATPEKELKLAERRRKDYERNG